MQAGTVPQPCKNAWKNTGRQAGRQAGDGRAGRRTRQRLPLVGEIEAVDRIEAHGIHLGRHDVQVDVLEHPHNVCGQRGSGEVCREMRCSAVKQGAATRARK